MVDYTQLPGWLDANFDRFDEFNALRATTIKLGGVWSRRSQAGLLSKPVTARMAAEAQRKERSRAFDLLDALSKSGALALSSTELHVVVAATHCFDLDVMNTVVQVCGVPFVCLCVCSQLVPRRCSRRNGELRCSPGVVVGGGGDGGSSCLLGANAHTTPATHGFSTLFPACVGLMLSVSCCKLNRTTLTRSLEWRHLG